VLIETADFAGALRTLAGDAVLVRPGAVLPELAAERLAWTAARTPGAATVSPITDSRPDAKQAVRRIDECAREVSRLEVAPLAAPSNDCVWVSHAAVQAALAADPQVDWQRFGALCTGLRYGHYLAGHIYCWIPDGPGTVGALSPTHRANVARHVHAGLAARGIAARSKPRQLHVLHGWGGGAEQWVRDYCAHDSGAINLVLLTEVAPDGSAVRLCLYRNPGDAVALRTWPLHPSITGSVEEHGAYRAAFYEALELTAPDRVIVSSLVGHSLDVLRSGLPTWMVCHDYYPFCPAFGITFGSTCASCGDSELAACTSGNPLASAFPRIPAAHWSALRARFLRDVEVGGLHLIAPSESVRRHYSALCPDLARRVHVIPHGTPPGASPLVPPATEGRLRLLVPGRLNRAKGLDLLEAVHTDIAEFADLILCGCGGAAAEAWSGRPHVTVIPAYSRHELPGLLQSLRPDAALMLSLVPETFSYTLQELFAAAIPPFAVRRGAYEDRIQDGVNGFLCHPSPAAMLARLRALDQDRGRLSRVHETLRVTPVRGVHDMIRDYVALTGASQHSSAAYFAPDLPEPPSAGPGHMQLFWRSPDVPFHDAASQVRTFDETVERQSLRFTIPPVFPSLAGLRLDPGVRPGAVQLTRMTLTDASGAAVWTWTGGAYFDGALQSQITDLGPGPGGSGRLLYLSGADPHFGLPREAVVRLVRGGEFEIEFSCPPVHEVFEIYRGLVMSCGEREAAAERRAHASEARAQHAESELAAARAALGRMEAEAADARADSQALRQSLSWKITAPLRAVVKPLSK